MSQQESGQQQAQGAGHGDGTANNPAAPGQGTDGNHAGPPAVQQAGASVVNAPSHQLLQEQALAALAQASTSSRTGEAALDYPQMGPPAARTPAAGPARSPRRSSGRGGASHLQQNLESHAELRRSDRLAAAGTGAGPGFGQPVGRGAGRGVPGAAAGGLGLGLGRGGPAQRGGHHQTLFVPPLYVPPPPPGAGGPANPPPPAPVINNSADAARALLGIAAPANVAQAPNPGDDPGDDDDSSDDDDNEGNNNDGGGGGDDASDSSSSSDDSSNGGAGPQNAPDHRLQFLRTPHGNNGGGSRFNGRWAGIQHLGSGGYGIAGLWVKLDAAENIIDRLVVKESDLGGLGHWDDPMCWAWWNAVPPPNPFDPSTAGQVVNSEVLPWEAYIMRIMPEGKGVVKYLGCSRYTATQAVRIYTEYCALGDLHDCLGVYHGSNQRLPKEIVWHIFLSLTEAAIKMTQPRGNPGRPYAREVVHMDLKPGNIFVAAPDAGDNPHMPSIKMGDFGNAAHTWGPDPIATAYLQATGDPDNPDAFGGTTLGWAPPERYLDCYAATHPNDPNNGTRTLVGPLTSEFAQSYTNVFQIGMIMRQMVVDPVQYSSAQPEFHLRRTVPVPTGGPRRRNPTRKRTTRRRNTPWPKELLDLIRECVRYQPDRRITAQALRQRLRDPKRLAARYGANRPGAAANFMPGKRDTYAMGLSLPSLANSIYPGVWP